MQEYLKYSDADTIARAASGFMAKVYGWMTLGLAATGITAYFVYSSGLIYEIFGSGMNVMLLIIAQFALVIILSSKINTLSKSTAGLLYFAYSILTGVTFSVILGAYTAESVQEVFLITGATFGLLSAYGFVTKRDLSGMGSFMFIGLIGLIIASLVNVFMTSSALHFAISVIGIVVFAGLTAWDTHKIKQMFLMNIDNEDYNSKGAILGALSLYLDFINLFIYLLRLLGNRR